MPDAQNGQKADKPACDPKDKWIARAVTYLESKLEERRAKKQQEPPADRAARRTADATWAIVVLTGVIMTVGFLQWRSMQGQLNEMRASGEDTKQLIKAAQDSAKAAQDAVTIAKETAKRQLRAFVAIESVSCAINGQMVRVMLTLKNTGQTPAYEVDAKIHIIPEIPGKTPWTFPATPEPLERSKLVMGANISATVGADFTPLAGSETFLPGLKDGTASMHVVGFAKYRDAFGDMHISNFRLRSARFENELVMLQPEEDGNESD